MSRRFALRLIVTRRADNGDNGGIPRRGRVWGFRETRLVAGPGRPYITGLGATTERRWSCVWRSTAVFRSR